MDTIKKDYTITRHFGEYLAELLAETTLGHENHPVMMLKHLLILPILLFNFTTMSAQQVDPWVEYMTPSDVHTLFSQYTGSFTMEITMSPTIISVNSDHSMLLGGRFLEMKQHGSMMGMDYQSIMTIGFNTTDKTVSMTTITNMGTGTLSLTGDWDVATKTATVVGRLTNPVSKSTINVRQVITFINNDSFLIESYDQEGDNPEKKTTQYRFVRQ